MLADAKRVRSLLQIADSKDDVEIVYGAGHLDGKHIAIVTRSVLGMLSELGAQIEGPTADVSSGATLPTVHSIGVETRPTIIVHVGEQIPKDAFVNVRYAGEVFWIVRDDFDSKFAFSLVQNVVSLAQIVQNAKSPVVTIPAG